MASKEREVRGLVASQAMGMSPQQWLEAKTLAGSARQRGRGGCQAETKLRTWGDVDGQAELFGVDR